MGEREQLNLFDFGENETGKYVNLVEEEEMSREISEKQLKKALAEHSNPLVRIIYNEMFGYGWDCKLKKDIIPLCEKIFATKCYHYGNMQKGLYIFSLYDERYDNSIFVFENENHYLIFHTGYDALKQRNLTIDEYLKSEQTFCFPALHCHCYDLNGNHIELYCDNPCTNDIRHIVCIKEWQMNKYSTNRMTAGKRIKDFYECEFCLRDLVNYFGESEVENGTE